MLNFTLSLLDEVRKIDCFWVNSNGSTDYAFINITSGNYRVIVDLHNHSLAPGVYLINYAIRKGDKGDAFDHGFTEISFAIGCTNRFARPAL